MSTFAKSNDAKAAIREFHQMMVEFQHLLEQHLSSLRDEMGDDDRLHFFADRSFLQETWRFEVLVTQDKASISARKK